MTVGEIMTKIQDINRLSALYDQGQLNEANIDELVDFAEEYKNKLLNMQVR